METNPVKLLILVDNTTKILLYASLKKYCKERVI